MYPFIFAQRDKGVEPIYFKVIEQKEKKKNA